MYNCILLGNIISSIPDKTHLPDTQNETEASPREIASLAFLLL